MIKYIYYYMRHFVILLLLIFCVAFSTIMGDTTQIDSVIISEDNLKTADPEITIKIERMYINNMELYDTLYVDIKSDGTPIAGFDFKIGIDNHLLDIIEVLPGEIYDSCQWEYFNAHQVNNYGKEDSPAMLWQIVALAEVVPDTVKPLCFGFEREASLIKIVLSNAHVLETPDTTIPIFFYWEDCTDNTLSGKTGTILMMSKLVRDYFGVQDKDETAIFPNQTGAPHQCIDQSALNKPYRWIEFHNGGVEFEFKIDLNPSDTTTADSL